MAHPFDWLRGRVAFDLHTKQKDRPARAVYHPNAPRHAVVYTTRNISVLRDRELIFPIVFYPSPLRGAARTMCMCVSIISITVAPEFSRLSARAVDWFPMGWFPVASRRIPDVDVCVLMRV